jgi:hypothetical protein
MAGQNKAKARQGKTKCRKRRGIRVHLARILMGELSFEKHLQYEVGFLKVACLLYILSQLSLNDEGCNAHAKHGQSH